MFCFTMVAISVSILMLIKFINLRNPPAILGIYQQANKYYYLKFILMYVTLLVKQLVQRRRWRRAVESGASDDGTRHVHDHDTWLERAHALPPHKSIDAVSFNATSKDNNVLVCGVTRRPGGVRNGYIYLKVEDGELLLSPELPCPSVERAEGESEAYSAAGIDVAMLIPMRSWTLRYSGDMKGRSGSRRSRVDLELTWSTKWERFDHSTDASAAAVARALAAEPWSSHYFQLLKRFHHNHYEQMGIINGKAVIDGKQHKLSMECVRSHTFGDHLDFKNIHRYVSHYIYLENGGRISLMTVSQPVVFSQLSVGYVCRAGERDHAARAITSCDLQLYRHGERGEPPTDYAFRFTADGATYEVSAAVGEEAWRYADGEEREARVLTRWATYRVNGARGWGCSEWLYRNSDDSSLHTD